MGSVTVIGGLVPSSLGVSQKPFDPTFQERDYGANFRI